MKVAALLCLAACGFPRPGDVAGDAPTLADADDRPRFTSFVLRYADNSNQLLHDAIGTIDEASHTILLRTFGAATAASFVATFETTPGATVVIGDAVQASGTTNLPTVPTPFDVVVGDQRTSYMVTIADREVTPVTGTAPTAGVMSQVVTGDLDGSGSDDYMVLFTPSLGPPQAIPFLTLVGGTSFGTMRATAVTLSTNADRLALADLDHDGHLDLLSHTKKTPSGTATLALAQGEPNAVFADQTPVLCAIGMDAFAVGDVDGDSFPDLVAATTSSVVVCPNLHNSGTFGFGSAMAVGTQGCVPTSVAIADLDGDHRPEIIVACQNQLKLVVYSKASGTWTPMDLPTLSVSPGPVAFATLYGDVDGLVVGNQSNAFLETRSFVDGMELQTPIGGDAKAFALADFDGDGWPDIAVPVQSGTLRIGVPGDPPTFQAALGGKPGPATPLDVAVGDFNGDHIPDAIFISATAVQLQLVK